jgi:hypothetical protein
MHAAIVVNLTRIAPNLKQAAMSPDRVTGNVTTYIRVPPDRSPPLKWKLGTEPLSILENGREGG